MCLLPHDTTKNTLEGLYNFIIDLREKIQLIIRDSGGDGVLDFCHNLVRTRSDATGGCAEDDNANGDDRDYNLNHVPGAKGSQVFQLDVLMAGGEVSDVDVDHEPEDVDDASSPYDEDDLYAMLTSVDAMPDLNLSHWFILLLKRVSPPPQSSVGFARWVEFHDFFSTQVYTF